jgi:LysM repeat protein
VALVVAGCSTPSDADAPPATVQADSAAGDTAAGSSEPAATGATEVPPTAGGSTDASPTATSGPSGAGSTTGDDPDDSTSPTTGPGTSASTTSSSSTTTTTEPPLDVYDPTCVVKVEPGESLSLIADRFDDELLNPATLRAENGLADDVIQPDQLLDVCAGNSMNDITGEQRLEPNAAVESITVRPKIEAQQRKLNELFAGLGIAELVVDGISGPVTRQRLCAFRVALGFPATREDMVSGSEEEAWLMALSSLPVPDTSARQSERWIVIDQTCEIMFVGAGADHLAFVFPTSTGEPGNETRPQNRSRIFRFDPALDNGGWHNSSTYPVAEDNPLNGNMYKPLYFDRGQAIHGANNVPTSPQSKGCARLRVEHQDMLVQWLGLAELTQPTGSARQINATVNVQGAFVA